jgi:hypothetical protein
MDFHDLIYDDELGNKAFVRRRPATATEVVGGEGETVTGYLPDVPLVGAVAPAKTADLAWAPEGARLDDLSWFICEEELRAGDGKTTVADLLIYNGVTFQALKAKDLSPWNVYMVLAQRVAV